VLPVGDHAGDGDRQRVAHLLEQRGQVIRRPAQQAAGQEHLARQAVAQHPQDLVADLGLQAVDGQHDATLRPQQGPQPLGVGGGQGLAFVVAVQQIGDRAGSHGDAPAGQRLVDLGDGAVLGMAEPAHQRNDVEAKLMVGQGEVGLGLRSVGPVVARAVGVGAGQVRVVFGAHRFHLPQGLVVAYAGRDPPGSPMESPPFHRSG